MKLSSNILLIIMATVTVSLAKLPDVTNERFYPLYNNTYRHLNLYGGAGSSKSHFATQKLITRCVVGEAHKFHHTFFALRKTQPAARKSVFELLKRKRISMGIDAISAIQDSSMTLTIMGSRIVCGGLDEPEKLKSMEGATGFWIEEATEFTEEDLRQVNLRLRGETPGTYKQILYTYNPIDINCHIYENLFRDLPQDKGFTGELKPDVYLHHSTYHDNRFIDAEYVKVLEGLEQEDVGFHHIYTLGLWGALKHLIYSNWVQEQWTGHKAFDDCCYGIDFGFNNPTALVQINILDQEPYIRQVIYESGLTNTALIEKMLEVVPDKSIPIYADNAEPARIEEIANAGFHILPATEGKKCVKDRIDFCKSRKIHIDSDSDDIRREVTTYKWKETRTGQVLDEPVKFADHCLVAGTMVATPDGSMPIEQVNPGDYVLTRWGVDMVMRAGITIPDANVWEYELGGVTLTGTQEHPIFTNENGFVPLGLLTPLNTYCILSLKGGNIWRRTKSDFLDASTYDGGHPGIGDAEIENLLAICTLLYGNMHMDKYQEVMSCITRMETDQIIDLRISLQKMHDNMLLTMGKQIHGYIAQHVKNILTNSAQAALYMSGIIAMQDERKWLRSERGGLQYRYNQQMQSVVNAGKNTRQYDCVKIDPSSAPRHVRRKQDVSRVLTILRETVSNAEISTCQISTKSDQSTALAVAPKLLSGKHVGSAPVYNLAVCHHPEFFANGLLVHNSMNAFEYGYYEHCRGVATPGIFGLG